MSLMCFEKNIFFRILAFFSERHVFQKVVRQYLMNGYMFLLIRIVNFLYYSPMYSVCQVKKPQKSRTYNLIQNKEYN